MRYLDYFKQYHNIDHLIMVLLEKNFSPEEIATIAEVTVPTVYNAKKRQETLLEALKQVATPPAEYGNKDVNAIVNAFKETFKTTKISKWDRFSAKRLADAHKAENVVQVIKLLAEYRGDKYTPTVNSVKQLEDKWVNVENYFTKKGKMQSQVIEL